MGDSKEPQKIKPVTNAIHLFFVLFLFFGVILWAIVMVFYDVQSKSMITALKSQERYTVNLQAKEVGKNIDGIASDLLFISRQNELQTYLDSGNNEVAREIEKEYKELIFRKKIYDQIRYLDASGQEIVRVNYNAGQPAAVDSQNLQNKGKRYYFTDSFKLRQGEIFISPLDLNVEHGQVEQPLKPMIRLGTPVFDAGGNKRGIVLINYLARGVLDTLRSTSNLSRGSPMLLNNQGYWLLSSDREKEWGFILKDRKNSRFSTAYPEEWASITRKKEGQLRTENGLFTFTTLYPLQENASSSSGSSEIYGPSLKELDSSQYFWVLVSHVGPDELAGYMTPLQLRIFFLGVGLFFFIAFCAWFLSLAITKRRIYQSQLLMMALYDPLTSLPNRKHFFDRLETGISHAKRYEKLLGVLYIDLDGFKNVNDTFGHEAGDELLVKVSRRMSAVVRKTDTVARLGGDEFAIILFQVDSVDGIRAVGEKIVRELSKPFKLKRGNVTIGASVGAAAYPDSTLETRDLLKFADRAMYVSKEKGKNRYTFFAHSPAPESEGQDSV